MSSNLLKRAAAAALVAAALTACATNKPEGPVFATAQPLAAAKPDEFGFKKAVRVMPLEGLNETVRRNLMVVLDPEDFTQSLRRSLANDDMLAPEPSQAVYALTPIFVDLRTGPVNEDATMAQATVRYRVVRREDGKTIFDRRVSADFTSIADPTFKGSGVFTRTLGAVGLAKPAPTPVYAHRPGADEARGPGPSWDTAREIHASRNAIARNIREAIRNLIAASPARMAPPVSVNPKPDAKDPNVILAPTDDTSNPYRPRPLPPLAPEVDGDSGN